MSKKAFYSCVPNTLRHTAALSSVCPRLTHAVSGTTDSSILLAARWRHLCAADISWLLYSYMCCLSAERTVERAVTYLSSLTFFSVCQYGLMHVTAHKLISIQYITRGHTLKNVFVRFK